MEQWIILATAATLAGWLFETMHVPVGWLLGPMLAGVAISAWRRQPRHLPPRYLLVGQALLGLGIGVGFPLATLKMAATHAVPLVLVVILTGAMSLLNGHLLWKWAGIDPATGFVGSLPGAASAMVAMSDELGADPVGVAVFQYIRLLLVVFLAPVAVHALFPSGAAGEGAAVTALSTLPNAPWAINLAALVACGLVGSFLGRRLHFPSPNFLGPFVTVVLVSWSVPFQFVLPTAFFNLGLLLVGLSIGARFDAAGAAKLGKAVLIEVVLVLVLILLCLAVGFGFHWLTGIDSMTAVLGSTPGGMEAMVAAAATLGGDPGLVLAMQMTRWFLVLVAGPWVAARLVRRPAQTSGD